MEVGIRLFVIPIVALIPEIKITFHPYHVWKLFISNKG